MRYMFLLEKWNYRFAVLHWYHFLDRTSLTTLSLPIDSIVTQNSPLRCVFFHILFLFPVPRRFMNVRHRYTATHIHFYIITNYLFFNKKQNNRPGKPTLDQKSERKPSAKPNMILRLMTNHVHANVMYIRLRSKQHKKSLKIPKWVIIIRISKNKQHNGQNKKVQRDKQRSTQQ